MRISLGIDVHWKKPWQKISRFCTMMNNIPNCNCVHCWPNPRLRYLVTTTFSRKYILTKIFACTPILGEKWKSVHVWRFLENGAIMMFFIPRTDRNKCQLELCALLPIATRDFFLRAEKLIFFLFCMEVKNLSIIFHGPRVTESYKIRNFEIS